MESSNSGRIRGQTSSNVPPSELEGCPASDEIPEPEEEEEEREEEEEWSEAEEERPVDVPGVVLERGADVEDDGGVFLEELVRGF